MILDAGAPPSAGTPILEVAGLRLGYGRADVVRGVDLVVPEGAIVALVGANGAGKTTVLRGLSGLLRPRAGSVRFRGVEVAGEAAHRVARRGIAQVPEGRQVFAELTVADNLAMGAYRLRDAREVARRREAVLARFPRLGERLRQRAGLLSGGEQQMLAMGRALMGDPALLLLDEPSMGLAPVIVEEVLALVVALKREGRAVLLVEQNARAALAIADHAYVLEAGRVALSGTGAALARDPAVASAYLGG